VRGQPSLAARAGAASDATAGHAASATTTFTHEHGARPHASEEWGTSEGNAVDDDDDDDDDDNDDNGEPTDHTDPAGYLRRSGVNRTADNTARAGGAAMHESHPPRRPPPPSVAPWDAAGPDPRSFCCTIDVRSVRALAVGPTLARVQVRYSYPFLGSSGPVYTAPVEVSRGSEKQFEQSFCSFEFRSTWNDVRGTFDSTPILLELLVSDR